MPRHPSRLRTGPQLPPFADPPFANPVDRGEMDRRILEKITDDQLAGLRWRDWTPTYTNLTVGNGTVVARYSKIGRTVNLHFSFTLGSTSSMGTAPQVSLPVTSISYSGNRNNIGGAYILDAGTLVYSAFVRPAGIDNMVIETFLASGTNLSITDITSTVPMTWTTSDVLAFSATYEAAG